MSPEMTLLGESLMPRLDAETFANDAAYRERILRLVREHKAGGFCIFGGGSDEVSEAVRSLRAMATNPLIFSADCEFGLPMRFKCGTEFPDAMAIAQTGDPELARKAGKAIALEMKALGLSWNFAPVADVNSNPDNPIINTRAFGDDPETVAEFAVPFMLGLQSEGVIATAKHFPGHGDTSVDSHRALPMIEGGLSRFETIEFPPFEALIAAGVKSVMTGHLAVPDLANDLGCYARERDLPATLSKALTTQLLRNRLGFGGVIVTDAMEMQAVRNAFGDGDATVRAFMAGADVVLMPPNPEAAFDALLQAVNDGRISAEDIRARVSRVRMLQDFAERVEPNLDRLIELQREHQPLANEIAHRAISLTGVAELHGASLVVLADQGTKETQRSKQFVERVGQIFGNVRTITPSNGELPSADEKTVLAVFHRARAYIDAAATDWTVPRMMRELGAKLANNGTPLAGLILFGNPYLDQHLTCAPRFTLKTFSESAASIEAASEKLLDIYNRP